ncbi:ATP-binding cassette domain-containing protein [Halobellus sp. GM3]|uniref:ATP-binding cassette domain-containing protein n=1 Tax=Halobellus sp. GM3 TaxID=3458410 RepID=UPI00403D94D1
MVPEEDGRQDTETRPVVSAVDISREYTRGDANIFGRGTAPSVQALDGVSLSVRPGEVVGIAGPSGSGKSTLLHLLAALDIPSSGTVSLNGTATDQYGVRGRTKLRLEHVGIVFQRFHLLSSLTARSNVALPLVELGWPKADRRERAVELLEEVGLDTRTTHRPGELSGGEQQRIAIARSLSTEPALVVADEPTGELDSQASTRVLELLRRITAEDRAVVLASHDQQAIDACDRVLYLQDGQISERVV